MPLDRRTAVAALAVLGLACTRPVPGILTLAPAGMRLTGTTTPHADGTLAMSVEATAAAAVYVDAGAVTITVTAKTAADDQPVLIAVWLAGTRIGTERVQKATAASFAFHGQARSSGPTPLQIRCSADGTAASPGNALEVQKVVVTQP